MNIEKINKEIEKFVSERDWDQFHSVKNLTMALSVEASELLEIFQWLSEDQSNMIKNDPRLKSKVQDELADVFVYLLRIIKKADVDIEAAVLAKIEKNKKKYPVELARGSAKKYDEY